MTDPSRLQTEANRSPFLLAKTRHPGTTTKTKKRVRSRQSIDPLPPSCFHKPRRFNKDPAQQRSYPRAFYYYYPVNLSVVAYWHTLILRAPSLAGLFAKRIYTCLFHRFHPDSLHRVISPVLRATDIFFHAIRCTFGIVVFMKGNGSSTVRRHPFLDTREIYGRQ